ncbi:hypothetical protein OG401_00425 [Kitasatospora purpeofusca]|uniref:hypothetical protein n=1 Tax=Kitasatospora purpeofusca TaxID=67352 RepID=UPI0022572318|nr:hypothetical protein [Kitasatospora purpeofusca]MCX4682787.1 hypothetical protein [Kitasatospora purpeofusca]
MPDVQSALDAESVALVAANSLATAMGTGIWELIRTGMGAIFQRRGYDQGAIVGQLDGDASLVTGDQADEIRGELVGPWRRRLQALADADPTVVAEFAALIAQVEARLPRESGSWVQNIKAEGHAVVNTVVGGKQVNNYMDPRRRADGSGADDPVEGELLG